jgi:hypothetical protein
MTSLSFAHTAPAALRSGPRCVTIEQTVLSFGFPALCHDGFNYRLISAIDLLCGGNRLFDGIDHFCYITALPLSFCLFTFHFSSNLLFWHGADFILVLSPFFAFFPVQRGNAKIVKLVETTKMLPIGNKSESPLANGI